MRNPNARVHPRSRGDGMPKQPEKDRRFSDDPYSSIPVDSRSKARRDLKCDLKNVACVDLSFGIYMILKTDAIDIGHDQVGLTRIGLNVENGNHVVMYDCGGCLGLGGTFAPL